MFSHSTFNIFKFQMNGRRTAQFKQRPRISQNLKTLQTRSVPVQTHFQKSHKQEVHVLLSTGKWRENKVVFRHTLTLNLVPVTCTCPSTNQKAFLMTSKSPHPCNYLNDSGIHLATAVQNPYPNPQNSLIEAQKSFLQQK